jgi:hypothetical protein
MKTVSYLKNFKSLSLSFIAIMLLAVTFTSCSKSNDNANLSAYVKVTNSSEASLPQDFFIDNTKVSSSAVAYTQSTDYLTTNTGDKQGQFKNTGSATANATINLDLAAGKYYSVFYVDGNSSTTYENDRTDPQTGKARVRFINLSSAISANVDFGVKAGAKLVTALAYKAASAYNDVDAATTFSLYASGSSSTILNIPATISAGHIYTIYISGATNATLSAHIITEK